MITDDIKKAFPQLNIPYVGGYYAKIAGWKRIFENDPPWSTVGKTGLYAKGKRNKNRLNVAKVLADELTALTFSEQVDITLDDKSYQDYIAEQLNSNGFWKNMIDLLSNAFALGGCVMKVYAADGKPRIDYIHADRFMPVAWNGKAITESIIENKSTSRGNYYTLFEHHRPESVEYSLFRSGDSSDVGEKVPLSELYPELPDKVDYGSDVPMFVYFKPAVSNNAEYDVPLGMSVYANAEDTLSALDTAFDSFAREVVLGKKRIIVPAQALTQYYDAKKGQWVNSFDSDDEAYVAFNAEDAENFKITDNTAALRIEEHVAAINAQLNILCFQTGLSAGSLSFDAVQGLKTATEVVSQESKTQRTVRNNKNLLAEAIEELVHGLVAVGVYLGLLKKREYTVTIGWQDNVIIDDNTLIDNTIKLYSAGLIDLQTALMRVHKCDEKTAAEMADKIGSASAIGSADFFGSSSSSSSDKPPDEKQEE